MLHPFIRVIGAAHTGSHWHIEVAVLLPGHLLNQQGHLFIHIQQVAFPAVFNGLFVHGAGVYPADGFLQFLHPFLLGALVHTEDGFVFAGECIAVSVLHDAAGTDNDWGGPVVVQHIAQLFTYIFGQGTAPQPFGQFLGLLKMFLFQTVSGL